MNKLGKLNKCACGVCIGLTLATVPCEASMWSSVGRWLFSYGDDAVRVVSRYGDDAMKAVSRYGDDAVRTVSHYGGKAINWAKYYTDDIFEWASKPGSWSIVRWFRGNRLGSLAHSLPQSQIDDLAKLSVKNAGKALGKLKLPADVLEDTWLRVLVKQGKLSVGKAEELLGKLGGVEGFSATLRKISSVNKAQQAGHLFELSLAERARDLGFEVTAIGKKFRDPAKKALTDLDVWLRKGGKNIYIEAKNYADVEMAFLSHFRADMDSLVSLGEGLKVFVISNRPRDPGVVKLLQSAADQRGVKLVFGEATDALRQVSRM